MNVEEYTVSIHLHINGFEPRLSIRKFRCQHAYMHINGFEPRLAIFIFYC